MKRGLACSTFAFSGAYSDAGYLACTQAACPLRPSRREVMGYEFDKLATAGYRRGADEGPRPAGWFHRAR